MSAPKRPSRELVITASVAAPAAGFVIGWAWAEHRAAFWTFAAIAIAAGFCAWLGRRLLCEEGTHTADPLTAPAELPAELLAAPIAEPPPCPECGQTTGTVRCGQFEVCRHCGVPVTENVPGRPADPARDQAPGPGGHPEGDTHLSAWPPQGAPGPGGLPPVLSPRLATALAVAAFLVEGLTEAKRATETSTEEGLSPLAKAAAAMAVVHDLPLSEYAGHLAEATGYAPSAPFTDWLSDETMARGFDAAKLMADVEEYGKRVSAA